MISSFGKYKTQPYTCIFKQDIQYFRWLYKQPWFKEKYKDEYNECHMIMNRPLDKKNGSFIIYTDGACPHNGSKKASMGIGIHFSRFNQISLEDISETIHHKTTSNNVAELWAIIKALQICLKHNITQNIVIYTDSKYTIDAITEWYPHWKQKGVLQQKKNIDLIENAYRYVSKYSIQFHHVRAHTRDMDEHSIGNRTADSLARKKFKM